MKKLLHMCIFTVLAIGPYQLAQSEETPPSADLSALQATSAPLAAEPEKKIDEEQEKKRKEEEAAKQESQEIKAATQAQAIEKKPPQVEVAPPPMAEKSVQVDAKVTPAPSETLSSKQEVIATPPASQMQPMVPSVQPKPVVVNDNTSPRTNWRMDRSTSGRGRGHFTERLAETAREARHPVQVTYPQQKPTVVVEKEGTFTSDIRSAVEATQARRIVTVQRPSEQSYRERVRREQEIARREIQLKEREYRLRDQEYRLDQKERAFRDCKWYNRKLRAREWIDINQRNQELDYLIWREQQMSNNYWRYNDRICRYVTTYRTGVRINKKVTICERRNGRMSCFHPKRYFIYPVTKLVCRTQPRPVIGRVIREYEEY